MHCIADIIAWQVRKERTNLVPVAKCLNFSDFILAKHSLSLYEYAIKTSILATLTKGDD